MEASLATFFTEQHSKALAGGASPPARQAGRDHFKPVTVTVTTLEQQSGGSLSWTIRKIRETSRVRLSDVSICRAIHAMSRAKREKKKNKAARSLIESGRNPAPTYGIGRACHIA